MIYKQKLEKHKYFKFKKLNFILFTFFILTLGYSFSFFKEPKIEKKVVEVDKVAVSNRVEIEDSFSLKSLKDYIHSLNLKHSDIIIAQAIQETGHFKSNIFKENNNLFGMKKAYQRPTTCIAVNKGHAVYSDWKSSVLDYALWQSKYGNYSNKEDYFEYLKRCYAQDNNYINKLKLIIKK